MIDHAHVHWYAYINRLDLILEIYAKYGIKLTKKVIKKIPLGDKRDAHAAAYVSKNKIEGIDTKGEKNVSYIDGRVAGKKFENGHWNDIMKKYQADWFQKWKENNPEAYQEKLARARQYKKDNREKLTKKRRIWYAKNKAKKLCMLIDK